MRALILAVCSGGLAAPAFGETYQAAAVDIVHAAATLEVIAENRSDIAVEITPGPRLTAPRIRQDGDRLVIDGGLGGRVRCGGGLGLGPPPVRVRGVGNVAQSDLPHIVLRTPRRLDLSSSGAVFGGIGPSDGGRVRLAGCGAIAMGAVSGDLDAALSGSGALALGDVAGALNARLDGSGALRGQRVGGAGDLQLAGSGDVNIATVAGAAHAELSGSGNLALGRLDQGATLRVSGSGNVAAGAVQHGLNASLAGSGNVSVGAFEHGDVELELAGSGNVGVRAGHADRLVVRNGGSGRVAFQGEAASLDAVLTGSGDIAVANVARVEAMNDRGSGDIRIGR